MSTNVNTNSLPVPSSDRSTPPVSSVPANRPAPSGRSFAEELAGPGRRPVDAEQTAVQASEQVKEAAERASNQLAQAADGTAPPTTPFEQADSVPTTPATLDSRSFKVAMRKHASAARDADPLAFLSGKLESINPEDIADLVSENPFITQALASGDLTAFMNQPVPVENLLDQLDVAVDVIEAVKAAGTDLSGTIAPKDFFKALGMDPGRVSAELTMLADGLPIDGVRPYIERAQRLQGKSIEKAEALLSSAQDATNKAKAQHVAQDNAARGAHATSAAAGFANATGAPVIPRAALKSITDQNLSGPREQNVVATQPGPVSVPASGLPSVSPPSRFSPAKIDQPGPLGEQLVRDAGFNQPRMPTTDVDPLAALDKANVVFEKLDTGSGPSLRAVGSTEEALMQSNWTPGTPLAKMAAPPVETADPVTGQLAMLSGLPSEPALAHNPMVGTERVITPQNQVTPAMIEKVAEDIGVEQTWQPPAAPKSQVPQATSTGRAFVPLVPEAGVATANLSAKAEARIPVEELRLDVSAWTRDSKDMADTGGDQFTGGDGQQPFDFQGEVSQIDRASSATSSTLSTDDAGFASSLGRDVTGPTTAERAQAVQQIMDRAVMMSKAGGGAVKLDFTGLHIGNLEMAISVAGNRVDLKILTESDSVRDALVGDISGLREALSSQNMSLGSVDVGLDNRDEGSAKQGFAGTGQFEQEGEQKAHEFQEEFSEFLADVTKRAKGTSENIAPNTRIPIAAARAYGQGQIALRV